MKTEKLDKFWLLATFILIVIIILSAVRVRSGNTRGRPLELAPAATEITADTILIEGAVQSPGRYPLQADDNLDSLIRAAGGTDASADTSAISLYIPRQDESAQPQLIDLNRAEYWLLCSLPDIGDVRARAIIDYRREHGRFNDIHEVTGVPGIGESTFEKIKDLITITP